MLKSFQLIKTTIGLYTISESALAFKNLDSSILEFKGFDGYVFGPNDLASSMGLTGQPGHPDVVHRAPDGRSNLGLVVAAF